MKKTRKKSDSLTTSTVADLQKKFNTLPEWVNKEFEFAYRRGVSHGLSVACDLTKKQCCRAVDIAMDMRYEETDFHDYMGEIHKRLFS